MIEWPDDLPAKPRPARNRDRNRWPARFGRLRRRWLLLWRGTP